MTLLQITISHIEAYVGFGLVVVGIIVSFVTMKIKTDRHEKEIEQLKKSHDVCAERQSERWEHAQRLAADVADRTALAEKTLLERLTEKWTVVAEALHQLEVKNINGLGDMAERLVKLQQQLDDLLVIVRKGQLQQ